MNQLRLTRLAILAIKKAYLKNLDYSKTINLNNVKARK